MKHKAFCCLLLASAAVSIPVAGHTEELEIVRLTIKDNRFEPSAIEVPTGKKFRLVIANEGDEEEEFDSADLNREVLVRGHQQGETLIGPLNPGQYRFIGENDPDTARGVIIAK